MGDENQFQTGGADPTHQRRGEALIGDEFDALRQLAGQLKKVSACMP